MCKNKITFFSKLIVIGVQTTVQRKGYSLRRSILDKKQETVLWSYSLAATMRLWVQAWVLDEEEEEKKKNGGGGGDGNSALVIHSPSATMRSKHGILTRRSHDKMKKKETVL